MLPIHTILHPTDLSELSQPAFQYANGLAQDYGATLVLLTVYPGPLEAEEQLDRDRHRIVLNEIRRRQREELKPDPSLKVDYRVVPGRPQDLILEVAKEVAADLIVMATYGESGPHRLVMGSVTEAVNRGAQCPVMAVRGEIAAVADRKPGTSRVATASRVKAAMAGSEKQRSPKATL